MKNFKLQKNVFFLNKFYVYSNRKNCVIFSEVDTWLKLGFEMKYVLEITLKIFYLANLSTQGFSPKTTIT